MSGQDPVQLGLQFSCYYWNTIKQEQFLIPKHKGSKKI